MANKKSDNQWYGKGSEQAIVIVKKSLPQINPYPEHIPDSDWSKILHYALNFVREYEKRYGEITTIEWIGNKTNTADGDLLINKEIIEIKFVETDSNGTWFNTTLFNTKNRYGLPKTYKDYMVEDGLYKALAEHFGEHLNYENNSPISQELASFTEKNEKEWYKNYTNAEKRTRVRFTKDFFNYLKDNPEMERQFVIDAVTKSICNKQIPDKLVVFNYAKGTIKDVYSKEQLMKLYDNGKVTMTSRQKLGFYAGKIRIAIGWQNGGGLNNPSIRGYIK